MKVAIDATPLVGRRTGVGVAVANALDALAGLGDLELVAYVASWRARHEGERSLPPGVRAVRRPMAAGLLHAAWLRADGPVIERWTGRVDVVHGTNCVVPPARDGAEVLTVHDLSFVRYPELCDPASLRFPALIRRALRRGAFVHTVAAPIAGEVVEHFEVPAERVRVVPWAVDRALAGGDGGPAPRGRAPAGGDGASPPLGRAPYVLSIGRSEPRKDLPLLVRAFDRIADRHPGVELVVSGPPGWDEEALQAAMAGARHRDRVRRVGWVSDPERASLLRGAAALAYPSRYEGFGFPPLEAMAAGVPVVATDGGGVPWVVGDAALVVPAGDGDALAEALDEVLTDETTRARLIERGRARAAGFSWQACAAGLASLYRDAAAARG